MGLELKERLQMVMEVELVPILVHLMMALEEEVVVHLNLVKVEEVVLMVLMV